MFVRSVFNSLKHLSIQITLLLYICFILCCQLIKRTCPPAKKEKVIFLSLDSWLRFGLSGLGPTLHEEEDVSDGPSETSLSSAWGTAATKGRAPVGVRARQPQAARVLVPRAKKICSRMRPQGSLAVPDRNNHTCQMGHVKLGVARGDGTRHDGSNWTGRRCLGWSK